MKLPIELSNLVIGNLASFKPIIWNEEIKCILCNQQFRNGEEVIDPNIINFENTKRTNPPVHKWCFKPGAFKIGDSVSFSRKVPGWWYDSAFKPAEIITVKGKLVKILNQGHIAIIELGERVPGSQEIYDASRGTGSRFFIQVGYDNLDPPLEYKII